MNMIPNKLNIEQDLTIPVVAIDGPAGSGKGTVRRILCHTLGFNNLDSGALYRIVAMLAIRSGKSKIEHLTDFARGLQVRMTDSEVFLFGQNVSAEIRTQAVDKLVPRIAKIPTVREELKATQLRMRVAPGLVAGGGDMCDMFVTPHKFYLFATADERAEGRYLELKAKGVQTTITEVLKALNERDRMDATRAVSPMKPHPEARIVHRNGQDAEAVAKRITTYVMYSDPSIFHQNVQP